MKRNILAMAIAMSVLMSGVALGASDTNEVYDFDEGTKPFLFVPTNQSVEFWNSFTGMEIEDGDWLNVTYSNVTGDYVSEYYYVEEVDEDTYINLTWNETDWIDVMGYGIFTENFTFEVIVSINNDSEESAIPLFPNEDFEYDGAYYSILPVSDKVFGVGDITMTYVEEYEADEDVLTDTGINWTTDDEPAVVFTYDDVEYPLTSFGFYYFEDDEIFVQVGEVAEEAGGITYVLLSNYDISMSGETVSETRRYWGQEGASFIARYLTGTTNTFAYADAGDYTVFDIPAGNIARIKIGSGAVMDYQVEMTGSDTYSISRLKRAYGTAESVADLAGTDSDVIVIAGVYFQRATAISFEFDDDDVLIFEENNVFIIDNSYDFGVKNWYAYGTKTTTWDVTGFSYF